MNIVNKPEQNVIESSHSTERYVRESISPATLKAYNSDFNIFCQWCEKQNMTRLPAQPLIVANFLASEADRGISGSTLNRRLAAIRYAHKAKGLVSPTSEPIVTATLKGIRRTQQRPVTKKTAATINHIHRLLAQIDNSSVGGMRDHALLLLGFSGAFRRSELVALNLADLEFKEQGITISIRKSKTDQEAEGVTIAVPNGKLRIVDVIKQWLSTGNITEGPIFRKVSKSGKVGQVALTDKSVALIIKKYANKAGLSAEDFAGHSLRSGFTTSAAEAGANIFKIMDVTRHKSVDTVRGYVTSADAYKDHAGDSFL